MTRILLIEDDVWLAESYREVLNDFDVDIAVDGHIAMDMIDTEDYDLVIADVMLERGLVFDLLHELRSYEDTAKLPVILCTSLAQRITLKDVQKYGVLAVLDKATLTPKLLKESVEQSLE